MSAMYVCLCHGITESQIRTAAAQGCDSVSELTMHTGAGSSCGSCLEMAMMVLEQARGRQPLPVLEQAA